MRIEFVALGLALSLLTPATAQAACSIEQRIELAKTGYDKVEVERLCSEAATPAPAAPSVDSVERDKALVGIAQAVKASDHAMAIKLIEGMERSGLGMPTAVHYFKVESLFALKRYTEADIAVRAYLKEGKSARYYEEALKLSLSINRGLESLKNQWRSELDSLLRALNTPAGMNGGWTQRDPGPIKLGDIRTEWYCTIYSDFAFTPTTRVEGGMLKINVQRTGNSGRNQCKVIKGDQETWAQPGDMEFEEPVLRAGYQHLNVPFHQLGNISFRKRTPKCDASSTRRFRKRYCPSSSSTMGKYVEMSLDGAGTIYLMDTSLPGRFERLGSLFRQLGGDVN